MKNNKRVEALFEFARGQAWCPCCEGVLRCRKGCTYKKDCDYGSSYSYQILLTARRALNTKG